MDQHQQPGTDLFVSELKIDDTAKRHIASLAQWAMIVVVTAVIGYVLSLVQYFTTDPEARTASEGFSGLSVGSEGLGGIIFGIVIGLLCNYFLYQFASQAKTSIAGSNPELLGSGFRSLKTYFIIITIILICVFLFALVVVLAVL